LLAGLLALTLAPSAHAQFSGSVTVASDFRLRGVSLTERRPALTLSGAYDHRSGIYAGGSVIAHDPESAPARILGHIEYLGYAARAENGLSWDVGAANVDLNLYAGQKYPLRYSQIYLGVARDSLSARLSLSPNYPRKGVSSAYLDVNGVVRPAEDWRITGHVGAMRRLGGTPHDGERDRYDVRLGVTRTFDNFELQASWTAVANRPKPHADRTDDGFQVGASYFF
jgi:uncharacterized protein (TIGR02001 family)